MPSKYTIRRTGAARSAPQKDNLLLAQLCSDPGRAVHANSSTYKHLLSRLCPGETMILDPGDYPPLKISGLRGLPSRCITIAGPSLGPPAVVRGLPGLMTVDIVNSSYVAIKNLVIDSRGIPGAFGISAGHATSSLTHHILIDGNTLIGQSGTQQTDGISTKTPTWGWVIRRNKILGAGTGIYLGNSDGSSPFFGGIVEGNLIQDPIGYCMQIKYQVPRPVVRGMPTAQSVTIIRHNVFIKNNQPSPDGDRPNLLVGGFPDSGPGSDDMYEIYGNFLYHNPREALFQGSGRISFHDNILVGGQNAAVFSDHDQPLKLAHVYNNTIYTAGVGILFANRAAVADAVIANLVFGAPPISGPLRKQRDNIVDELGNATQYVKSPSLSLQAMNFYPVGSETEGPPLDLSLFDNDVDYRLDFNHNPKARRTFRGAYAGSGRNPGWKLTAAVKSMTASDR